MEVYEFKVVSISLDIDMGEIKMHCKAHPTYTSIIFLKVPQDQISKFSIGQIYSLRRSDLYEVVETVPVGGIKSLTVPHGDVWESGSPLPDEAER